MVDVLHARPEEREEIARFMQEVFPRAKWSLEGWRTLLDGRWSGPAGRYAITARDDGRLVGVLGLVTAERPSLDGPVMTANMTSWYVLKPYRGQGLGHRMIGLAAADPTVTLTNFTSSRGAVPVVESAGMQPLDRERLLWRSRPAARAGLSVHPEPIRADIGIGAKDRRVLEDHAGLNLMRLAVATPDGPCVLLLSVKRKSDAWLTYEALYLGNRDAFARHARAIADSILPPEGAVLSVDRRLLPAEAEPDAVETFDVPRFYIPGRLPPEEIDYLYSEIVLLDMKLS